MAPSRFLGGANSPPPPSVDINNSENIETAVDADFVVILAALLCALICILGLVAVARCAWFRRFSNTSPPSPPDANKGLKKKVLKSLPKHTYPHDEALKLTECAICLTEFVEGDEIRLLPQCGHGFHVGCIDTWLGSHSSCPSCQQILVVARCHKCGEFPPSNATGAETSSSSAGREQQIQVPTFLPLYV